MEQGQVNKMDKPVYKTIETICKYSVAFDMAQFLLAVLAVFILLFLGTFQVHLK